MIKFKLNIHFVIIFFIAILSSFNDFVIYFFRIRYIYSFIISGSFIGLIFWFFILRNKNISLDFEKNDIFLYILLIIYMLKKGIFKIDNTYDVSVYHIYLQENPFLDKINFDFFPGRIFCCFLFPLGDRMNYIFRYFLGYRLGTILSYYAIIIVYYQIKNILKILNKNIRSTAIYSYIILFIFMFIAFAGSYYIDNYATIFLLEIFYLTILDDIPLNKKIYWIAIFSGISIGIKITSIYFIIIFIMFLLIRNKNELKNIRIYKYILCGILCIFPFILYIIDNYKQTESIIFPYYNEMLKSKYFGFFNWVEPRFGINGILNKTFWPIIVSLQYKCYGDDSYYIDPIWAIGYIVLILYLLYKIFKKSKKDSLFWVSIISLICTIIWIKFLYGYTRYGIIVVILYCIVMSSLCIRVLQRKKDILNKMSLKIKEALKVLFKLKNDIKLRSIVYIFSLVIFIVSGIISISEDFDYENFKYILKDRKCDKYSISIDGVWGSVLNNCSSEVLVREKNVPIYNLEKEYYEGSEKALKMYYERMRKNNIYMIVDVGSKTKDNSKLLECLEKNKFEIKEFVREYKSDEIPYIDTDATWYLVKLNYKGE